MLDPRRTDGCGVPMSGSIASARETWNRNEKAASRAACWSGERCYWKGTSSSTPTALCPLFSR